MALDPEAGARLRAFMEPRIGKVQPWSERHGIGRDTIYALWRGREPQPDTMARIAEAMGVTYERLLRERAGLAETGPGTDLASVLSDLVTELREARTERRAMAARVEEMDEVLRTLVGRTTAIEAEHAARPHSAGSGR